MKKLLILIGVITPLFAISPVDGNRTINEAEERIVVDTFYHSIIIDDIIRREGLHTIIDDSTVVSYNALVHDQVIGFGHHDPYVDTISLDNAFHLMLADLKKFQKQVQEKYPKLDNIQSLAIAMLAYNGGINCIGEQLNIELKKGKDPTSLLKYHHYNGVSSTNLKKSRELEYAIFTKDTTELNIFKTKNYNHVKQKFRRYEQECAIEGLSDALQEKRQVYTLLASSYFRVW